MEANNALLKSNGEPLLESMSADAIEDQLSSKPPKVIFDIFLSFRSIDWIKVYALHKADRDLREESVC